MTTTTTMREINRSNATRNYLEHINRAARTKRALELEASLYGWRGVSSKAAAKSTAAMEMGSEIDEARKLCEAIGGTEGEVLRKHYIDGKAYADIARAMAYSERQIGRFAMRGRVAMFDMLTPYWRYTVLAA